MAELDGFDAEAKGLAAGCELDPVNTLKGDVVEAANDANPEEAKACAEAGFKDEDVAFSACIDALLGDASLVLLSGGRIVEVTPKPLLCVG